VHATEEQAAERTVVFVSSLLYLSVFLVFVGALGYDAFRSDAADFWRLSLRWQAPFSALWVPLYPLTIAFVRGVTFGMFSAVTVMWSISAVFYVVSVVVAYRLLCALAIPRALGFALAYAVFPFVGMVGSVYPVATNMAMAFFFLAALAHTRKRWLAFGVYVGLALVTHKALWFVFLPLLAMTFVSQRESRPFISLSILPVALLWAGGTVHFGDPWWMIGWSAKNLMWSPGALPLFDGLMTSLLSDRPPKLLKGTLILALFVTAAMSLYCCLRRRFWLGVAVGMSTLAMTAVLNQHEVLAVAHYARPLVIPVAYCVTHGLKLDDRRVSWALVGAIAVGVVTNFGFAEYMTAYYYTGPGQPR
jgi:hypothetical protein